jgi:hypothetical protein
MPFIVFMVISPLVNHCGPHADRHRTCKEMASETRNRNRHEASEDKTGWRGFVIEYLTECARGTSDRQTKSPKCDAAITKQNRTETFDAQRQ